MGGAGAEELSRCRTAESLQVNARGAAYCQAHEALSFLSSSNSPPSASSESPAVTLSKGLTLTDTLSLLWVEHFYSGENSVSFEEKILPRFFFFCICVTSARAFKEAYLFVDALWYVAFEA